jgi:ComF family protein
MRVPFLSQDGCCRVCGRSVESAAGGFVCEECRHLSTAYDAAASAVLFENDARDLLHKYKSGESVWLKDDFVDWIDAAARARYDLTQVDAVVPMPITLFHRIDRGYNQCVYLARSLAKRIDRICLENVVVRCGHPRRQAGLSEEERRENVIGTFKVVDASLVRGRTILLVDDVMATGSTLSECAKTLKDGGAWRVWGLTLARSVR